MKLLELRERIFLANLLNEYMWEHVHKLSGETNPQQIQFAAQQGAKS